MSETTMTLALAAGVGTIAGMRSMAAPALVSRRLSQQTVRRRDAVPFLSSSRAATLLTALAAGEMVADKTPFVPDRVAPMALAGRALSGALTAAAVAGRRGKVSLGAALIASAAAVGSAFCAYTLRRAAGRSTRVPDAVFGLVEDAIVLAAGTRLARAVARR